MKIPPFDGSSPHCHRDSRKDGSILFLMMTILATLAILAGTLFSVTATDVQISGNYKNSIEAFNNADAGMKYVEDRLMAGIASGTVHMNGQVVPVHNIGVPTGFNFDPVTQLTRLGDKRTYLFRVTGRSLNARSTVEATVQKANGYPWALFGGDHVKLMQNSNVAGGNVGSNGHIEVNTHGATIDGDATPGPGEAVTGNPAAVTGSTTPATELVVLDPIDANDLAYASANNNNAAISPGYFLGNDLTVPPNNVLTLPEGTYYFTKMVIGNNVAINTSGEVLIYVDGELDFKAGSTSNNTDADLLRIYCTTTQNISIRHGSELHAHIYAPNSPKLELKADGGFYGSAVTGGIMEAKMDGDFFLEGNSDAGKDWAVTSWKYVRY